MKKNTLKAINNNLYAMNNVQMKKINGGTQMSTGFAGGSPSNPQNGYDTASRTTSGTTASWDGVQWYNMCGEATVGHIM